MLYKCPKCGRKVELPPGTYYCRVCGPTVLLIPAENPPPETKEAWEEAVGRFKLSMWSIYHAVEEGDWERLRRADIFRDPRFLEAVEKAEPYFYGRYDMPLRSYIGALRELVEKRDACGCFRIIAEILLCLKPTTPWIH